MKKGLFLFALLFLLASCGSFKRGSKTKAPTKRVEAFEHDILEPNRKKEGQTSAPIKGEADEEELSLDLSQSMDAFIDEWYGTPHRMGGMSKKGVDCSGFVIIAYQEVFKKQFQGRRAEDIFGEMQALNLEDLKYGDLVFFKVRGRRIDHVGIYLNDLKFVHTSSSRGVMISSLTNAYWQKRFFKGGRYKD